MSILYQMIHGRWKVRKTIWPYKEGYGTYNPRTGMVLDTGLSKKEATKRCKELNSRTSTPDHKWWYYDRLD